MLQQSKTSKTAEIRENFQFEIRRRTNRQRLSEMRSKAFLANTDQKSAVQKAKKIVSQLNKENINAHLSALKLLSIQAEAVKEMLPAVSLLCETVLTAERGSPHFDQAVTIIINLTVFCELTLPFQFSKKICRMILTPEREHLVLWLLSNLLLRKNEQSKEIFAYLISIDVIKYTTMRIHKSFDQKQFFLIFNGFCCHLLSNSEKLKFEDYKNLLRALEAIQDFGLQETDQQLSLSMIDHAPFLSQHNYQFFSTNLFKKFHQYCKLKKSRFVKHYLQFILAFIEIQTIPQTYDRLKKYGVFTSLHFCLDNRLQEVKRLCAVIGSTLIANFQQQIDLQSEDFYSMLGMEVVHIEKYQENLQQALLLFIQKLIYLSIERKGQQELLKMIENAEIGYHLVALVKTHRELVTSLCLRILQIVMPISVRIKKQCQSEGLFLVLNEQEFKNPQIKTQVLEFLDENL